MYEEPSTGLSLLENVTYVFDNIIILLSFVWLFLLLLFIVASIGKWLTFKKINRNGYEALIPYHNTYEILKVASMPGWHIFLLMIPIWGIVENIKIHMKFAEAIGKSKGFGVCLALFPFIFFLILGFDKRPSFFANPNDKFIATANAQEGMNNAYLVDSFSNVETFNAPQMQASNQMQQTQGSAPIQYVSPNYGSQVNMQVPNQMTPQMGMQVPNQMSGQMLNQQMPGQTGNQYPQNNIPQDNSNNIFDVPNNQS